MNIGRSRRRRRFLERNVNGEQLESRRLLAGDLIAHWFAQDLTDSTPEGGEVATWVDVQGGIEAQAQGQPTLSHAALGGRAAIQFTPSDGSDFFSIGSLASPMRNISNFTVAVVFATHSTNLEGGTGDWFANTALIDAYGLGFANDWGITLNRTGQVGVGLGQLGGETTSLYTDQTGTNDGQPHLAVFRHQDDEITVQLDDHPVVSASPVSSEPRSSLDMAIGNRNHVDAPFEGYIAEVRIYDGALDPASTQTLFDEVSRRYNNQVPQANPDSYTLREDSQLFYVEAATGVLSNDFDPESDELTAVVVQPTEHGVLSLADDGSIAYSPEQDFFGTDTFTYAAVDFRRSTPTTVSLNVTPLYDPAEAIDDDYDALPNQSLQINAEQGVLANDDNPDHADLTVILEESTSDGILSLNEDGSFTYDAQGFVGSTHFRYRIDDGRQQTSVATVQIQVNTPPATNADNYSANEDVFLTVNSDAGVLHNDKDADGHSLTAQIVEEPSHGALTFQPDGSFTYISHEEYFGTDQFSYTVTDGVTSSRPTMVSIDVRPINDPPVAVADTYFALPDRVLTIPVDRGVLANDSDVDNSSFSAQLQSGPERGTVELAADGSFRYTPEAGFLGQDRFVYVADDSVDRSEATQVQLTISDRPLVINEFMAANASTLTTRVRTTPEDSFRGEDLTPDWIELKNLVSEPIDLTDLHLTDDPDDLTKWSFPAGTVIAPDSYLIVFASGKNVRSPQLDERGNLHTDFRISSEGDYLAITAADGTIIHEIQAESVDQYADISYGLIDEAFRFFQTPSPGAVNQGGLFGRVEQPQVDVERGYFEEPFTVQLSASLPDTTLVYTLDGSEPTLDQGMQVVAADEETAPSTSLMIDRTTTLRARSFSTNHLPSPSATHTYFFTDDLIQQSNLWSRITEDTTWGPQLRDSLTALPSISLVMDGRITAAREVATSVEMIFPDGEEGFQIDGGVEHFGGHSLNSPKKNMRISFKSIYGPSHLSYNLFGDGATTEFNQLLLRTGSHDTWFWVHPSGGRGNYLRNRWAFDRQLEMGHLAPHGRFVQVFINGEYWGIHQLMERPDASFMASYLGGEPEDYDALNAGTPIDGDAQAWRTLQRDEVIDDYDQVQQYLNVVNYADYMLLQFYAGNDWDWNHDQNWAAARRREAGAGFIFFSWDSDVVLRTTAGANVINRGGPSNLWNIRGGMRQHDEFLMLMADRAHRYFFNEGMFTNERLRSDVDALADRLRLALIAETARWGRRGHQGLQYTPDVWQGAVDWMKDTFAPVNRTGRTETVLQQLRRAGIYPEIAAPEFLVNAVRQHGGRITERDAVEFVAPEGTVYFTFDGSDPRQPGGELNPAAQVYSGVPLELKQSVTIKARTRNSETEEWSALSEAEFRVNTVPADESNLRISEIHYHPADPTAAEIAAGFTDADEFEFLELVNLSSHTLDMSGVRLLRELDDQGQQGVDFSFAESALQLLPPGKRLVVVENEAAFVTRYGAELPIAGQWSGGLGNAGERVTLSADGRTLIQFQYSDDWYPATDGDGYSLVVASLNQETALWADPTGWRVSSALGGSPGAEDPSMQVVGDSNHDGRFDSSDLVAVFQSGEYEDLTDGNSTWEEGDWNGDGDFTSSDLVFAFQSGSYSNSATLLYASSARKGDQLAGLAVEKQRVVPRTDTFVPLDELTGALRVLAARDAIFGSWI